MNFSGINYESFADGDGIRVSFFVSGCRRHCKGCFNAEAQSFCFGEPFTQSVLNIVIDHLNKPYISGVTLLGGEPMEPENIPGLTLLAGAVKNLGKTVWIYSGFTYEEIMEDSSMRELLSLCDVLVDGPFILDQRDITLSYRGSRNQRIIDVQTSLKTGEIVLYQL